ncbi:polysaccharide deacetylase family protein [Rhodoblastus sp.]|uniref:polysaccharide deacetylase family protein n=1 Tax=Rhodoblastus sp. TaxID=1962975 RepID=UPI003F9AC52E
MSPDKIRAAAGRRLARLFATRCVTMRNERPIVSFSFDDFPRSAATTGARLLGEAGAAGSFYLCRDLAGKTVDGVEYFSIDDLETLAKAGHEIGCHTAEHIRLPAHTRDEIASSFNANKEFIESALPGYIASTFAYPFGDANVRTKLFAQSRFAGCRSTFEGINAGIVDLGAIKACRLYSGRTDLAKIKDLVARTVRARGWLNLYTHDLSDKPTAHGATPDLLRAAIQEARDQGCDILTVKNALGAIAFRRAACHTR